MIGKSALGSPLREICTMGSERGDEYKRPCSLGEGTGSKEPDNSAAPQWATASRLVPTHQQDHRAIKRRNRARPSDSREAILARALLVSELGSLKQIWEQPSHNMSKGESQARRFGPESCRDPNFERRSATLPSWCPGNIPSHYRVLVQEN
jgi:hypothetical protein